MNSFHILRSLLFVPGSRPELLHKAEASGPDAIVLDLEDSVPPDAKIQARAAVTDALRQRAGRLTFIRINHPTLGMLEQDVITLAAHGSQVVMLPKVESTCDVSALDRRLKEFEQTHGLPDAAIGVMIAIESAIGLRNLYDTLREALAYSRGKFVCDARAAGALWLMDGAFMNLEGSQALEREAMLARRYGFNGKVAIHPRQVSAINSVFSPTLDEVDRAIRIIEAFRAAEAEGRGALKFEGMMVDYANVKRAEQILSIAGR